MNVPVKIWDFNSQWVMDGCFNIFLRRDSIVVITYNMIDYNSDVHLKHWLSSIKATTHQGPVFVVFTFVDQFVKEYNFSVEARAQQIVEKYRDYVPIQVIWKKEKKSRAKAYDSDDELNEYAKIQNAILRCPLVERTVPYNVIQFSTLLKKVGYTLLEERGQPPVISLNKLMSYGNMCGIKGLKQIMNAAFSLHSTGCILTFPAPVSLFVLDPPWLGLFMSELFAYSRIALSPLVDAHGLAALLRYYPSGMRSSVIPLLEACKLAVPLTINHTPVEYIGAFLPESPSNPTIITQKRGSHELLRILRFDFLPQALMSTLIQKTLETFQKQIKVMEIWKNGIYILLHYNITLSIIASITTDEALGLCQSPKHLPVMSISYPTVTAKISNGTLPDGDELVLKVESSVDKTTRKVFAQLTDLCYLITTHWPSIELKSYCICGGYLICLDDFDPFIKDCHFLFDVNGVTIQLLDVIPDLLISTYSGPRYSLNHISFDVCI
eukprot:TRINITY_DN12296_c0_g1_i1.p1 TRINITY_DN12296_c0_g1~~TRINITY_DN12296_c0_g1_i1.p1  ORF type:complete len:495 (+),score=72.40 TRINITY_DN12296_c0_g1_i1:107-1591(+)